MALFTHLVVGTKSSGTVGVTRPHVFHNPTGWFRLIYMTLVSRVARESAQCAFTFQASAWVSLAKASHEGNSETGWEVPTKGHGMTLKQPFL